MNDTSQFGTFAPKGLSKRLIEMTLSMPDTWFGRRRAYFLRKIGLMFLKGKPVDVERFGARLRLYPYHNVCEKRVLFTPQYFDFEERFYLNTFLEKHPGHFTFLDIGSNIGAYALCAGAQAKCQATIIAVEPQPDIFDRLIYNIQQNGQGCIKAISCAIADKSGELTLFLNSENKGQSSVKIVGTTQGNSVKVPALSLLDLIEQEGLSSIDIIKLDVEGAEDLIIGPFFKDAQKSFFPKLIIIEDGRKQWQTDIPQILSDNGYALKKQTRLNLIYELERDL